MESIKNLSLQSRIHIELIDGDCYVGTLSAYNQKFKFIELIEMANVESKKKLDGAQTYYESEIENIRSLDATPSDSVKSAISSTEPEQKYFCNDDIEFAQPTSVADPMPYSPNESMDPVTTSIDDAEEKVINERIRTAVYITHCDVSYHSALHDLESQEIVGLNIEGARLGRLRNGSLLSFCTNEKIYLFDLMLLGRIFPEIKRILEAKRPRKVVHNSSLIVDHLKHRHKCQLNGIQDILVTHFNIKKKKSVITIDECLNEYFAIPMKPRPKVETDWAKRPLSDRRKIIAAFNVAYLIKLFFHMTVDIYLLPMHRMTSEYACTYSQNGDFVDVFDHITHRRNPGLASIDINGNDLNVLKLSDLSEDE